MYILWLNGAGTGSGGWRPQAESAPASPTAPRRFPATAADHDARQRARRAIRVQRALLTAPDQVDTLGRTWSQSRHGDLMSGILAL